MNKDEILAKFASLPLEVLDKDRDKKILELREVLAKYHKAKDEELVKRHEKRNKLLSEGNSFNKTEQLLRSDEELYLLKRTILELVSLKNKIKLELLILNNYFWKAKM